MKQERKEKKRCVSFQSIPSQVVLFVEKKWNFVGVSVCYFYMKRGFFNKKQTILSSCSGTRVWSPERDGMLFQEEYSSLTKLFVIGFRKIDFVDLAVVKNEWKMREFTKKPGWTTFGSSFALNSSCSFVFFCSFGKIIGDGGLILKICKETKHM